MFNKEEATAKAAVQTFAALVLDLLPVNPDRGKVLWVVTEIAIQAR